MTGIYLKCDECGATIDGAEVTRDPPGQRPLHWSESPTLRREAAKLGWTQPEPGKDLCPECSKPPNAAMSRGPAPNQDNQGLPGPSARWQG